MSSRFFGALAIVAALAGCAAAPQTAAEAAAPAAAPSPQYVIDVHPHIALHRAFVAEGNTYLEFLDAYRMNPVITGPDGIPLPFRWNQQYVVVDGIHPNLTVTTAHGMAHVYAKQPAPPSRVAAPTPVRAPEYGVSLPLAQPIVHD